MIIVATFVASASAQVNRVYVAASGSDSAPCTSVAPCRTIVHAIGVVDAGGDVLITENGEYDQFFAGKSVSVAAAPGIDANITTTGGYGVVIVGGVKSDIVAIRNLNFRGPGATVDSTGLSNVSAGTVYIDNCTFRGFSNAINWGNIGGYLYIHETTIRNSLFGIGAAVNGPEGVVRVTIDHCLLEANDTGIALGNKSISSITNTVANNHTSRAVSIRASVAGMRADATIDNCVFNTNTVGILLPAAAGVSTARLSRTTISNSALAGVSIGTSNIVYTLQNNTIAGNFPDVIGNLTPLSLK